MYCCPVDTPGSVRAVIYEVQFNMEAKSLRTNVTQPCSKAADILIQTSPPHLHVCQYLLQCPYCRAPPSNPLTSPDLFSISPSRTPASTGQLRLLCASHSCVCRNVSHLLQTPEATRRWTVSKHARLASG